MSCPRAQELDLAAFALERHQPEWAGFRDHYPRCADCSREVAAWSRLFGVLRPESANPGPPAGEHPAEADLLAYQRERASLTPALRERIEAHLEGCGACRSELAVLRRFDFSQLSAPQASPARQESAESESWLERLTRALGVLFGPIPQPALALGTVALLLLPAGFVLWRVFASGGAPRETLPAPSVAVREAPVEPRPEPVPQAVEPPAPVEVAEQTPPPPAAPTPPRVEPAPPEPAPEPAVVAQQPAPAQTSSSAGPSAPEPEPIAEAVPEPIRIAALLPSQTPHYDPSLALELGPADGMRVTTLIRTGAPPLPEVQALAPDHVGLTTEASPELYWDLSGPSSVPVEITVTSPDAIDPLLEERLSPPVAGGLHTLSLAERGVELAPGVTYQWQVALVPDEAHRDADVATGGTILRRPPDAALAAELAATPTPQRAHRLAAAGYWYDAFATLSDWVANEPGAPALRHHRDALLDQVGLEEQAERLDR